LNIKNIKMRSGCETGCSVLSGGEIYHHKDCQFYPGSFSELYDDLRLKFELLNKHVVIKFGNTDFMKKKSIYSKIKGCFSLSTYRMKPDSLFKLEFKKGDDIWRQSIWITHWWFGKYYWHCLFI